jgi:transcriptional regulator with XRE-family HTH domain
MSEMSECKQAIGKANKNLADLRERGILTPEEMAAGGLRVAMMVEIARARKEQGLSQRKLEELSGVKQPVIARMERGETSPQLDTVLKILAPLGKTLAVVPLLDVYNKLEEAQTDIDAGRFEDAQESLKGLRDEMEKRRL